MTDNLRHWTALETTDRSATKPFQRAGGFKGTATKPIYHEKRMTEHFGPCGIGWGMKKPEFQIVTAEGEILVYCTVALWYRDSGQGGQMAEVYGVGGDKVVAQQRSGPFVSDEAFKAAFTDALGNAMKHIGVGADIHMGEFDKYGRDRDDAPPVQQRNAAPPPRQAEPASTTPGLATRLADTPATTTGQIPPPNPEEPPTIGRQRVEALCVKLNAAIQGAKNSVALDAMWGSADTKLDLALVEAGGKAGKEAAYKLRSRYMARADQLKDAEAMA